MGKYYLAIDQGTTGSTALLVDSSKLSLIDKINQEFPQIYPSPGFVEHDLGDIWKSITDVIKQIISQNNVKPGDIKAIGITNQRETTCAFTRDGESLHNAIVWQDRRTADYCGKLKNQGLEEKVKTVTGLTLDPYFSGTKMNWLLQNSADVKKAADNESLRFGTIDTYILHQLSAGQAYFTEPSNASRTLLMDLKTTKWNDDLLQTFGIDKKFLPEIKPSFSNFGVTKGLNFLEDGIPVTGILGDQQSALFGQACFDQGGLKCTYGTGAFLLLNTGQEIKYSNNGLLTTVAYQDGNEVYYALEGSSYIAGAAVQWLRDNLKIINKAPEIEMLAKQVTDLSQMKNILFMPFFTGIGSPYWVSDATAAIVGLTRDSGNEHIARACLEGVCLSINDLVNAMKKDFGQTIPFIRVDGGACVNDFFMQLQSNFSELTITRPKLIETTGFGAACAAAIGIGDFKKQDICETWQKDKDFGPEEDLNYFQNKSEQWTNWINKMFL